MFTQKITEADSFTTLPPTTQCLYFHLCMNADDDGFSNKIRQAMFNAHADQNDFEMLVQKRFIIPFDSGVIVIKHWRMHNLIRSDRYHKTDYIEERSTLILKENGVYVDNSECEIDRNIVGIPSDNQVTTIGIPSDNQMEPEVRLGKDSIGNINTPLTPLGENKPDKTAKKNKTKSTTGYDYKKHTNIENACYVLNYLDYKEKDWLMENKDTWECIKVWLKYKDERKDRYKGDTSLTRLFTMFVNNVKDYGLDAVSKVVDESIASDYKGITWDRLQRYPQKPKNQNAFPPSEDGSDNDEWENLSDDEWEEKMKALDWGDKNV